MDGIEGSATYPTHKAVRVLQEFNAHVSNRHAKHSKSFANMVGHYSSDTLGY